MGRLACGFSLSSVAAALIALAAYTAPVVASTTYPGDFIGNGFSNIVSPDSNFLTVSGRIEEGAVLLKSGTIFVQYAYSEETPVPYAAYIGEFASNFDNWDTGTNITSFVSLEGDKWSNTLTIASDAGVATGNIFIDVVGNETEGVYVYPWYGVAIDVVEAHVIPLPPTLVLLFGAFGIMGLCRWRAGGPARS